MRNVLQVTKPLVMAFVLAWLIAACGGPLAMPPQASPTTVPSAIPSPAASQATVVAPSQAGLSGLLTQVRGDVTVLEITDAGEQSTRRARPMQVLSAGATVQLPAEAFLGLICSSDQWIDLQGELDWQLTESACDQGRGLPSGTYQSMAPQAGRILSLEGSWVIVSKTREKKDDYGRIPIILSPRNTNLLELEPELRWVEVTGAFEYVLSIVGPMPFEEITLDVAELCCAEDIQASPHRVCSVPWPASKWELDKSGRYFLTISARTGIASKPRPSEASDLQILSDGSSGQIRSAIVEIESINLDPVSQDLLMAELYAKHELNMEVIKAYKRILEVQPAPEIYVALGDIYSEITLFRWAYDAYRTSIELLSQGEDDPAVRAAAEFGIGRVYFNYEDNFVEAEKHFAEAVRLYEQVNAPEALAAAKRGVEEARERMP